MRMTLKSRGMSDVMLDMEASADDEKDDDAKMVDATKDDEATTGAKGKRVEGSRFFDCALQNYQATAIPV